VCSVFAADLFDENADERRRFDGTILVDEVYRVIRGDGNGPLSALLDALRTHLDIDLTVWEYSEHAINESENVKAASYVELVPAGNQKSAQSWWGGQYRFRYCRLRAMRLTECSEQRNCRFLMVYWRLEC
jgi:hypothetical protein